MPTNAYWERLIDKGIIEVFAAPGLDHSGLKGLHVKIESGWGYPEAFTLYQQGSANTVVHRYWQRGYDYDDVVTEGAARDTPSIVIRHAELDETFNALWLQGKQISVPLVGVEQQRGQDGADYVIEFSGWAAQARLSFWTGGPPEWRPFLDWFSQVMGVFRRALEPVLPHQDPRTNATLIYRREWWFTRNKALRLPREPKQPLPEAEIERFEAQLPAPLPLDYRRILAQFGPEDIGEPGKLIFNLYAPEHILTLYAELEQHQFVMTDTGRIPVIPFAADEKGLLLLELSTGAVWRKQGSNVERVTDNLARFIVQMQHAWGLLYGIT